jgi:iron complex outermembrane receptor protein
MSQIRSTQRGHTFDHFALKPLVRSVFLALTLGSGVLLQAHAAQAEEAQQAATAPAETQPAQKPNASAEGAALPSVTVTAQKREEDVQDVPTTVSVLNGKDLEDKGIGRSASEILNYVPNASAGTQLHGRPRWWIRGVGAGNQQIDISSPVGFYLDEVYISNANATGFPLFDLDQIQVLSGPQGTLWGKNTTGGAIAISSVKPSFNETDNDDYVKVDYGSYNDKIVEGAVGGVIIPERLAGRISFHQEDSDGRFTNLATGQKDGGLQDGAIRGQLLAELTPNLEALLNVHYRKYDTSGAITTVASYSPTGIYRGSYIPSTDPNTVDSNAPNNSNTSQNGASLNLKWQIGKYTLNSITGYEDYSATTLADTDYTPLEGSRSYTDATSRQYTQEFRLTSPREDRWNWITGLYYFNEKVDSNTAAADLGTLASSSGTFGTPSYSDTIYSQKAESVALFGSNTFNFTDQLKATLGARYTEETKDLTFSRINSVNLGASNPYGNVGTWWSTFNPAYTGNAGTFNASRSTTWNALTYDFTPEYKLTPDSLVYYKFAHGVKSGGYNTAAASLAALQTVAPETLNSNEIGYKSEWFDKKLKFDATAFHYDYDNIQVNVVAPLSGVPGTTTTSYLQNASRGHAYGAEFLVEALPLYNLHLSGNLGLLHTQFDEFQAVTGANLSGNQFVRSPHVNALITADYFIPVNNGAKVILGADTHFQSQQYYFVTPQDTVNRAFTQQGAYSVTNFRVSYSSDKDKYTVTAYSNNLFDKKYLNHALPSDVPGVVNGDTVYWAQPRTVGLSFIARW